MAARHILEGLFCALTHIHSKGIIHRDIKPANILLSHPSGPAFLADFGIAWSPDDPASEPPDQKITDVGTTCYRPPELLFGHKAYGPAIDMWAAGCVAAECVRNGLKAGDAEWTLFDAGEVGSELALVKSIFETLGTPTDETWPVSSESQSHSQNTHREPQEAQTFPDWNKMSFHAFPPRSWKDLLPLAPDDALDLVASLVVYQSTQRLTAQEVSSTETQSEKKGRKEKNKSTLLTAEKTRPKPTSSSKTHKQHLNHPTQPIKIKNMIQNHSPPNSNLTHKPTNHQTPPLSLQTRQDRTGQDKDSASKTKQNKTNKHKRATSPHLTARVLISRVP